MLRPTYVTVEQTSARLLKIFALNKYSAIINW